MKQTYILSLFLPLFLAGCTLIQKGVRTLDPADKSHRITGQEGQVSTIPAADRPRPEGEKLVEAISSKDIQGGFPPSVGSASSTSPLGISRCGIWHDPAFKARFIASYIADTEIEPPVTIVERSTLVTVFDLIKAEKMEDAATTLQNARGSSSSAVMDFTFANIHFQHDKLEQASEAYQVAVQKYPKFRRAWSNLALVYFRMGNLGKAVGAFTRVLELGGGDAITYGLLGVAYAKSNDDIAAESAFRMAALLDPNTMDWKMGLAESFFKQRRYNDAVALIGRLITKYPDRVDLWLAQGEAYARLGRPIKAAGNFEIADRLGGATVVSLHNLGDIYANKQLYDLAAQTYLRALKCDSGGDPARPLRAATFFCANGALAESRLLAKEIETVHGAGLSPKNHKNLLKLQARIAAAEGEGEEKAMVLKKIVQLDPLDGDALILLGRHFTRVGRVEKAIFYFERAAGLEDFEADAKVRHAQLLVGQGKYSQALPLLRRAQTLQPRDNIQKYLKQVERVALKR